MNVLKMSRAVFLFKKASREQKAELSLLIRNKILKRIEKSDKDLTVHEHQVDASLLKQIYHNKLLHF